MTDFPTHGMDRRALDVARRVWRITRPTDAETLKGARRIGRALRADRVAKAKHWAGSMIGGALIGFGFFAYAKSGGLFEGDPVRVESVQVAEVSPHSLDEASIAPGVPHQATESARSETTRAVPTQRRSFELSELERVTEDESAGDDVEAQALEQRSARSFTGRRSSAQASTSTAKGTRRARVTPAATIATPDWHAVREALRDGDTASARDSLQGMATATDDDSTRVNAQLGLAQLELANGDLLAACKIARAIDVTNLSAGQQARAQRLRQRSCVFSQRPVK